MLAKTRKYMQIFFVCGEPNGNRKLHAVALTVSRGTAQKSLWKYQWSVNSLGGLF